MVMELLVILVSQYSSPLVYCQDSLFLKLTVEEIACPALRCLLLLQPRFEKEERVLWKRMCAEKTRMARVFLLLPFILPFPVCSSLPFQNQEVRGGAEARLSPDEGELHLVQLILNRSFW